MKNVSATAALKQQYRDQLKNYMRAEENINIVKDSRNPLRRIIRHTLLKKKYGDMCSYHCNMVDYLAGMPTVDLDMAREAAERDTDAFLEKVAQKAAEKENRKQARTQAKAAKKAAKNGTDQDELFVDPEDFEDPIATAADAEVIGNAVKGEDGLYHYTPIIIHGGEEKEEN